MAIHDAWARRTPYELFLPDDDFARERFAAIRAEAEERRTGTRDPERFVLLMAAGETLQELRGPGDDAERLAQHGHLLFHAFHFHEAGEPLWLLTTPAARYVVEAAGDGGAVPPRPPTAAGYLQLPQHLFWLAGGGEARGGGVSPGGGRGHGADAGGPEDAGDAGSPPQSVDGIFWTVDDPDGDGAAEVSVLAVTGVRPDRPGFGVVPVQGAPLADAGSWVSTPMRPDGEDFRSEMPGADIDALYELRTAGELLKLLARAWTLADIEGADLREPPEPGAADDPAAAPAPGGPPPSGLPWYRISLA